MLEHADISWACKLELLWTRGSVDDDPHVCAGKDLDASESLDGCGDELAVIVDEDGPIEL